ncbi:MAG: hypothetical protein G01um101466_700 [Parcubacteria group bacterium Gr01-1014_66]|nr:MAG: hypothetical protein G01um101466_700 [Parcubacteria group bacterium Gr01-1014_66]
MASNPILISFYILIRLPCGVDEQYVARLIENICDLAWQHAMEKLSKLLETPKSRNSNNVIRKDDRDRIKMFRIGQSATKPLPKGTLRDYNGSFLDYSKNQKKSSGVYSDFLNNPGRWYSPFFLEKESSKEP